MVSRILIVGDERVGETTLIKTLVSQHCSEKVPALIHNVLTFELKEAKSFFAIPNRLSKVRQLSFFIKSSRLPNVVASFLPLFLRLMIVCENVANAYVFCFNWGNHGIFR